LTFKGLCCACGIDTTKQPLNHKYDNKQQKRIGVSLDWMFPGKSGFVVNDVGSIRNIFESDAKIMLANRKLRLVLDLDETLIHSVSISNAEQESMFLEYQKRLQQEHFLNGTRVKCFTYNVPNPAIGNCNYLNFEHLKLHQKLFQVQVEQLDHDCFTFVLDQKRFVVFLRPYLEQFLAESSQYFDMYIYTNGTERYASVIYQHFATLFRKNYIQAMFTRKSAKIRSKKQLLKMLCKRSISIIVDDRCDVWVEDDRENIINVGPYKYEGFLSEKSTDEDLMDDTSEILVDDEDDELLNLTQHLRLIHSHFFAESASHGTELDVRHIIQDLRDSN
jgi:hypothetical protein